MQPVAVRIRQNLDHIPLGAKRRPTLNGSQNWFPYYAGYSLEFAESVLLAMNLRSGAHVYDPWNGSGTTTVAASRLGLASTGKDLNPAALLVARARLVHPNDAQAVEGFVRRVAVLARGARSEPANDDPLRRWLHPSTVAVFRCVQDHIIRELATNVDGILEIESSKFPPLAAFLLVAAIRAASTLARMHASSNPSRVVPTRDTLQESPLSLCDIWPATTFSMANSLPGSLPPKAQAQIELGDARVATDYATADFVLTSPPYLTRLDYVDSTSFILAAIGKSHNSAYYNELRRHMMGAPLVRDRAIPSIPATWPCSIAKLLHTIKQHPSKASSSYYYKTYWQYFDDASQALIALKNTMKRHSYAALVLQSSYYKDVRVDLPALYADLAGTMHFSVEIAWETQVRTVISSIHPGTRMYRKSPDYKESLVLIKRR